MQDDGQGQDKLAGARSARAPAHHWIVPVQSCTLITLSIAVVWWLVGLAQYGIDFTDEGHYLNSIAYPSHYKVNLPPSLFGYLLNPIYEAFNADVARLRQAGIWTTFVLAWGLCLTVLHTVLQPQGRISLMQVAIAASIACLALVYYANGLMTPSYNLVNLHGLILVALGAALARQPITPSSLAGWAIIGLGGWLVFMAKPSSAAIVALLVPLTLLAAGTFRLKLAAWSASIALSLLLISSLFIDGSPQLTVARYLRSVQMQQLLGGGHDTASIFRVGLPQFSLRDLAVVIPSTAFVITTSWLGARRRNAPGTWQLAGSLAIAVVTLIVMLLGYFPGSYGRYAAGQQNTVLFPLTLALGMFVLAMSGWRVPWVKARRPLALLLFVGALPYAYVFGTNTDYWISGSNAGFFWVLAGVVSTVLIPRKIFPTTVLVSVAFLFPLLTVVLLDKGLQYPYRGHPNLRASTTDYDLDQGGRLILPPSFAGYISAASTVAKRAGLDRGRFVIDMTGQSGGLLYALGLKSLGLPWLIGGYPGSNVVASNALSWESCDIIVSAWLLVEPDGGRRLSVEVLEQFGADLAVDYELTGLFEVAPYAGGRTAGVTVEQGFLRPIRSPANAVAACERTREGKSG